jgi:putative acetyltransferase
MRIRRSAPEESDRLFEIWRRAVEATHHFLSPADLNAISAAVRDDYLPSASLWVAADERDRAVAFMGLTGSSVDTLFVDPDFHRRGIGTAMMAHARKIAGPIRVDVNEQNELALAFYKRLGFRAAGRSEQDGAGMPYPLLHLVAK